MQYRSLAYFIRIVLSGFHAAINGRASFFYMVEEYFGVCVLHSFSMCSSVDT